MIPQAAQNPKPILATTSNPTLTSPVELIRNLFNERQSKNSHYSLNAFSRDLGISPSLLSRLLSGARNLTLKQGLHFAAILGFSQADTNLFVLAIIENAPSSAKISKKVRETIRNKAKASVTSSVTTTSPLYTNCDIERFKIISQWYHLAILNLTFTECFESTPVFISERLGISVGQAKSAVDRLTELGLLEEDTDGRLLKTQLNFYFKTERSEFAMREHQGQMMNKAKLEMEKTDQAHFGERLINSITFACAPEHVDLLKKKIDEFQDEVLATTKSGPHREVYQFNCQLFPLTQTQKKLKPEKMR